MKILASVVLVVATVLAAPVPATASAPRPWVSRLSVASGPVAGGTSVTILGRHFTRRSTVRFGGVRARTSYRSSHRLVALTPAHAAGTVAVQVRTGHRTSRPAKRSRFTFVAAPVAAPAAPTPPVVWAQVATGGYHTCGIKTDGSLWCWGDNYYSQLGNSLDAGTEAAHPVPTRVGTDSTWTSVDVGFSTSCGIRSDHSLWCWGGNYDGQLGDPADTAFEVATPSRVSGGGSWSSVAVGLTFACATRTDGTLWCWGKNDNGQLGNSVNVGTSASNPTPTRVGTASSWVSVSAGDYHACATRSDGTLWCWGGNYWGQLGNSGGVGTGTPYPTPAQVGTATDWSALGVGEYSTCATKTTGTLWCWGSNFGGSSPTQQGTDSAWRSVSTGDYHGCGTTAVGALECWGFNDVGQLGRGTSDGTFHDPGLVGAGAWKQVDSGSRDGCAIKADGTLWCWGDNYWGELGNTTNNGTYNPNSTPVQVP